MAEDKNPSTDFPVKALWFGRPFGAVVPPDFREIPAVRKYLQEGAQIVYGHAPDSISQARCILFEVRAGVAAAAATETLCTSCRGELLEAERLLSALIDGEAATGSLDLLAESAGKLFGEGHCRAAREAAGPLGSALEFFRPEFDAHAIARSCPARVCPRLITAPCRNACPAGIDIPGYLSLVARGRHQEALECIREDNPFPWVCGLICPHPCEPACVRANLDQSLNIRYLERFVAEWATRHSSYPTATPGAGNGTKVAVIGSGPAGLTAAHYLALGGYRVTVFEALPEPGGLLMYGIPEYRLPKWIVRREIEAIRCLGVEIRTGIRVGKDVTLEGLHGLGFKAFFLGIGAHRGYKPGIAGESRVTGVFDAISFLRKVNSGSRERPGERVVVIGGGKSATDAARTCIRLGCREVHLVYRRTRKDMSANPHEVEEAMEEGVQFHFLMVPVRVGGEDGRLECLECLRAELGQSDASGRGRPIPVEGSNFRIPADAVIAAIGREPDFTSFADDIPFEIGPRSLILTDGSRTETGAEGVFAGGDAVTGPATVVKAIAAGKLAALEIDQYLCGSGEQRSKLCNLGRQKAPSLTGTDSEKTNALRAPSAVAAAAGKEQTSEPVELESSEEQARQEAARCLLCDVSIR